MNFGHHPDPAIDFTCEVDAIEGEIVDRAAGLAPTMDLELRIEQAMQFKVGGDTKAIVAKHDLRKAEAAFKAGAAYASALAQAREVPAGYALVPIKPTPEMCVAMAGLDGWSPEDPDRPCGQRWADYWDAAIAAAKAQGEPIASTQEPK